MVSIGTFLTFFLVYNVGLDPTRMGRTLAAVQLITQLLSLASIPLFRRVLRSGRLRPWDFTISA